MSKAPSAELPKSVDPYRLAEQNATLEGEIPLSALTRFRDSLRSVEPADSCRVSLAFSMDGERRRQVHGDVEADVVVQCQRCMGPMTVALQSRFRLGLVTSDEQAQQLPKELEPFLTDDFNADLWSMVEDELLLALPPFPLHERGDCPAADVLAAFESDGQVEEPQREVKDNPFSVLADLKPRKH